MASRTGTFYCKGCLDMFGTLDGLRALGSTSGYLHPIFSCSDYRLERLPAERRCALCAMLSGNNYLYYSAAEPLVVFAQRADDRVHEIREDSSSSYPFQGLSFDWLTFQMKDPLLPPAGFFAFTAEDDPAATYLSVRPSVDVADDTAVCWVRSWLSECQDHHPQCHPRTSNSLPTRVLDVGSPARCTSVKLHVTDVAERAAYVALSYCWGGPQAFRTTTETLGEKCQGFGVETLPKTIQDAVVTTRNLRIRYLWIDALCIIQDDAMDMAREVAAMGTTYKNATVTIVAANASKASDGFLGPRPPTRGCQLPFCLPEGNFGTISVTGPEDYFLSGEPLMSRGWTLQEYILSPRLLIYSSNQLLWQCPSRELIPMTENHITHKAEMPDMSSTQLEGDPARQANWWSDLISEYSGRAFTFLEDRQKALAGIIADLQTAWGDTYLAGCWRRTFIQNIAWVRSPESHKDTTTKSAAIYAPSWSWLAVDYRVRMLGNTQQLAELVSYNIELESLEAPFGQVKPVGKIVLRAKVMDAAVQSVHGHAWAKYPDLDGEEMLGDEVVYALLAWTPMIMPVVGDETEADGYHHGLILKPLYDGEKESFRRVGFFDFSRFQDWQGVSWREILVV